MVADGLLTRQRYREVPPRVDYELTERARDLIPVLAALARWGYEWSWSEPRRSEAIDVGAVFRLAPGLLALPRSLRGTVELTVLQRSKDGEDRHYLLTLRRGDVTLEERADGDAGARITGTERAWVDALAPGGARDALKTEGDARLVAAVLDGLVPAITRAAAAA
jgi:HxlR-like helix-turn-helix protein